jgi:hypothetical protein
MPLTQEMQPTVLLNSPNVDVSINPRYGGNCMYFQFKGTFDKNASEKSTKAWREEFESNPTTRYKQIWDCTQMKDFHFDAKNSWSDTLSKFESRIDVIYVVSESIIIRGAARLMTKFSKYNLEVFKTVGEMYHFDQAAD